jgi:DNA-binding NtrC family response regulator
MVLQQPSSNSAASDAGPAPAARDFSSMAKKSAGARVLIVDDEPLIRWSLAETLTEGGCEVVEAADRRGALRAVADAAAPFDVVFLDFRLPDSNDLGLLGELRRRAPQAGVILMTAFGTPDVTRDALDLGACRVVSKPLEMNELASLVTFARKAGST